ncbi:hypothetical protein SEA_BOBSWAGET_40 [Mycobacterium phage BobSwaget]|nr:hypothetical protein SEA_BOBSWAGET_40 [Mycobacterium phage BobSwaget]ASW31385.1 hypothetical protein SEA_LOKK_41 [Mycobacterium phage Lokk]QDF18436.1 hypothetical protein SEA_RACHALY_41 [Mycobacterium Phage Rachaly]
MNIEINILGYELLILARRKPPGPTVVVSDEGLISHEDLREILRLRP